MMRKQIIIILCFLMVFICLGFCSSTRSLYLVPVTEALDIPRSAFSLTESCQYVMTAVVNLFFGTLTNQFGTKKLIGAPRAYNLTLGLFVSGNTAGYACAGPVMNRVFDVCGSYKPVFIVCGLIMSAVMLCFQYVIRVSKQLGQNWSFIGSRNLEPSD